MENVRQHRNIELIHNETRLRKVAAKPTYKTTTIFNEDLVAVELYKTNVKLFKPIYCGMSILGMYALFYFLCFACFDKRTISIFHQSRVRIKTVS